MISSIRKVLLYVLLYCTILLTESYMKPGAEGVNSFMTEAVII